MSNQTGTSDSGIISNYLENKFVSRFVRVLADEEPYTPPTQMYMALYTNALGAGDSDNGSEVSSFSTNYARQLITPSTDFEIIDNIIYNKESISFDTALLSWGTIYGWGIRDSEYGGQLLFHGLFDLSVSIPAGETLRIPPENLEIRFSNTSATSGGWTLFSACQVWSWMLKGTPFIWSSEEMYMALGRDVVLADTTHNIFNSWTEISTTGTDYGRQIISGQSWSVPTISGISRNLSTIVFSEEATADWGVVSDIVLYDTVGGTHPLFWAHLSTPVTVNEGDGFKIAAGGLQLQFD